MKRLLLGLLSYFIIFNNCAVPKATEEPTKLFMGSIQFPAVFDYDLCLYYKGQKVSTENSTKDSSVQFSFLESQYAQEVFVLICENVSYETENNTIQNLKIAEGAYKCYRLQAARMYDEHHSITGFSWDIEEYELENGIIPDNTLVFLFNPNFVHGLVVHSWKADNTLRIVPTIMIHQEVTLEQIKRATTIARLAAIDIDTIHTKTTTRSAQSQSAQALLTFIQ